MVRALEHAGYVQPRPWVPAPHPPCRRVEGKDEKLRVHTGTGAAGEFCGSSTFLVFDSARVSHSLVKDKHLLVSVKRLALPVAFVLRFFGDRPPQTIVARHVGTLALNIPGEQPIEVDNVYFTPETPYNLIGDAKDWTSSCICCRIEHTHVPTGVRFRCREGSTRAIDLPHSGPGFCKPLPVGEEVPDDLRLDLYEPEEAMETDE
ncbi:hypothetical protein Q8F55_006351 [Vanrija albida]|uniref:Uncharacterized protein n=1 Tax=Vanrija albida TaxID=181172 RepID=A0ABR3PWX8_9TREE